MIVVSQDVCLYLLTGIHFFYGHCHFYVIQIDFIKCTFFYSQSWVLRSTAEYASKVINSMGPRKPSADALAKVAEELFKEFQATGLNIPQPIFMKAHRWWVF